LDPETVSAYIVATFEPMRRGLAEILSGAPEVDLLGVAPSLDVMVDEEGYKADVVVIDLHAILGTDTAAIAQRIVEWIPKMKILFLGDAQEAMSQGFESLSPTLMLHTVGFMFRTGSAKRLVRAVELVGTGTFVCETDVIKTALGRLAKSAVSVVNTDGQLSEREVEVLALVARGRTNREIARELFVSEGTIKAHVSHIMSKAGVERRSNLVKYALDHGILLADD
jgi:DNA-binding NarL/FixJ family response regulator